VDPLEWSGVEWSGEGVDVDFLFFSLHSVQGGEMAGLRQEVGKGKGEEGLAETIDDNITISQQHQAPKSSSIAIPQEDYIATSSSS
jgi:hypothetical protein